MGIDWEKPFKKYIIKKFKKEMNIDLPFDAISTIQMDLNIDFSVLKLKELAMLYSMSIMTENYEQAQKISKELKKRNCILKINIDEKKREGTVDIFLQSQTEVAIVQINLIATPDGMMVDWEKENF